MNLHNTTRVIDMNDDRQRKNVIDFLKEMGLGFDKDTEYTLILEKDGQMAATASFAGKVIKQVGVKKEFQGEGITSLLLDPIIKEMFSRGRDHIFVYTRPVYEDMFVSMGFKMVAGVVTRVVLLEWGSYSIDKYVNDLKKKRVFQSDEQIAAVVVNCNPFTMGHRYLLEKVSRENTGVYVFVVKEDRSLFPYNVRLELVKKGVVDLKNIQVLEGGDYIISSATFPAYFIRDEERVETQTVLDIEIFGKYIAPALDIKRRYAGEEPYCGVTQQYNRTMEKLLPSWGIEFVEVKRKETDGIPVSASTVRDCIRKGDWDLLKKLVPSSTLDFLLSQEARPIIEKIKSTHSRH